MKIYENYARSIEKKVKKTIKKWSLHKHKPENNIQYREPEPVSSWSVILEIIGSEMRDDQRHNSCPQEISG